MTTTPERLEATRLVAASPAAVFAVLTDPQGHVAIDASGMLQEADGEVVTAVGDRFTVHMDREALGDLPMGRYDVDVVIEQLEPEQLIAWSVDGTVQPPIGHVFGYRLEPAEGGTRVTSFYDWSRARDDIKSRGIFPVVSAATLRATLGVLERAARRGYPGRVPTTGPDDVEAEIRTLVAAFYAAFTSGPDSAQRLEVLRALLHPSAVVARTCGLEPLVMGVDDFIAPRARLLSSGELVDFHEWELSGRVQVFGDLAVYVGTYAKSGVQDGAPFEGRGLKAMHLVRTREGWRVTAAAWDDEREGVRLP